jgi:molecular chaperone IbpA
MLHNFYPISREFDAIFDDFTRKAFKSADTYPVYNIFEDESEIHIEIAVTGLGEENLKAYIDDGYLVVEGKYPDEKDKNFIHKGLSKKDFIRKFWLDKNYEVEEIDVKNGLMQIKVVKKEPDRLLIPINGEVKKLEPS